MVVIFCTLLTSAPRSGEGFAICLSLTWGCGGRLCQPSELYSEVWGRGGGGGFTIPLSLTGVGDGGGLCLFPWGCGYRVLGMVVHMSAIHTYSGLHSGLPQLSMKSKRSRECLLQ